MNIWTTADVVQASLPAGSGSILASCFETGSKDASRTRTLEACATFPALRFPPQSRIALVALTLSLAFGSFAAQPLSDDKLLAIQFEQKLAGQVSPELTFRDEDGRAVRLGDYFGKRPVILVLGYYQCPMLCSLTLNGMVEGLADLKWSIGREFDAVNVSIDPSETPALAQAKKERYLKRYGRAGAAGGWHFLTGDDANIRALAGSVGFRYAHDPASNQFAHPSGLVVLTPEGKVSGYLFGVTYPPKELFASLQAASSNQIRSPIKQFILLCFHYNPITGKYGAAIMTAVRIGAIVTLLGLAWLIVSFSRRPRTVPATAEPSGKPAEVPPRA